VKFAENLYAQLLIAIVLDVRVGYFSPMHWANSPSGIAGAALRARCSQVSELPARGPAEAKSTIASRSPIQNEAEAILVKGADELSVKVERAT
jgi:hypothetical protein